MTATIERLEKKAAKEVVESVHESFGLSYTDVASALGVNRRTLLRYRNKLNIPSPKARAGMEKMREIRYLLHEVFNGKSAENEWLYSSVPLLRGRRPIDLMREGELDQVLSVLAGLYSGSYI